MTGDRAAGPRAVPDPRPGHPSEEGGAGLRPGQVIAGRYRIHRLLGRGGMGEVYRADDLTLGRYVALKFPRLDGPAAGDAQRLAAEVAVAQRVSHPNVCRVHELARHEGRVFLSMQLVEGESLRTVLDRTVGALSGEEKLRIAHDLCAALSAIHSAGVLFRDLKPSNVMLDSDGRALVTDFGLAACRPVADPRSGTSDYMAPEQLRDPPAGPSVRSDLYALGLVLYELFAGRPAFPSSPREQVAERKRRGPPPDFPLEQPVPEEVREAVLRCLAPASDERPASADEVAGALPERPDHRPRPGGEWIVPPQTLLVSPRWRPRPWRARALLGATVLALLAVAALAPRSQLTLAAERGDPPQALEVRARQVISAAGLETGEGEEVSGYTSDPRQLEHVAARDDSPDRWVRLAEAAATETVVEPGAVAFMGEVLVEAKVKIKHADAAQSHFLRLLEPETARRGYTARALLGSALYLGNLRRVDRSPGKEERFLDVAERKVFKKHPEWQSVVRTHAPSPDR